jgi:sigma-B regulation protein RsbU (phosphoserine phosphatase)
MGKGLPAALFANTLQTVIRGLAEPELRPAELLTDVNRIMFDELSSEDIFITAQAAVVDLPRHKLRVANAGHCPLLISDGSDLVTAIAADGIPLGIQPDVRFPEQCVPLPAFSSVLLYTDGVTEARNSPGNFFGQQRLENWFRGCVQANQTAQQLKLSLLEELAAFQGTESAADDQTFLIFCDQAPRPAILPTIESSRWFSPWHYVKSVRTQPLAAG